MTATITHAEKAAIPIRNHALVITSLPVSLRGGKWLTSFNQVSIEQCDITLS